MVRSGFSSSVANVTTGVNVRGGIIHSPFAIKHWSPVRISPKRRFGSVGALIVVAGFAKNQKPDDFRRPAPLASRRRGDNSQPALGRFALAVTIVQPTRAGAAAWRNFMAYSFSKKLENHCQVALEPQNVPPLPHPTQQTTLRPGMTPFKLRVTYGGKMAKRRK